MLAGIGVLICASQLQVMVDDKPLSSGLANILAIPRALHKGLLGGDGGNHQLAFVLGGLTILTTVLWNRYRPARLQALPGPLVGVLLAVGLAALAHANVQYVSIPASLWGALQPPSFGILSEAIHNPAWLGAAFSLAAIASAETLLCASAIDRMQDKVRTHYNRELLAQGVGNGICGALGALPMTGVIVRSSANVAAGAQTRMSSVLHGVWVLAIVVLTPGLLRLVPTASLAGVLVHTGCKLVSTQQMRELRQYGWGSVAIYGITLSAVVLTDLLMGVLLGLGLSLVRLLFKLGAFDLEVMRKHADAPRVDVHVRGAVTFVGLPRLAALLETVPAVREVHLHVGELRYIDHACLIAIGDYVRQQRARGTQVHIDWDNLELRSEKVLDETGGVLAVGS
jgi:MFS superfamily sulfate permease-like transporter